jgi:hypothetical protein
MSPQERARELVSKYRNIIMSFLSDRMKKENAKECAIIAVDEIISNIEPSVSMDVISARINYWEQVKKEIEKL